MAIGEDIEQLKQLKNNYLTIIKSIEENVSSETENLNNACESLAKKILEKLKTSQELETYVSELTYLANKTISSKELNLQYCEKLILLDEEYELGLKNYKELESKKIDSTKDCFDYLEKIFTYKEFFEIQNLFNELKNTPVTESNLFFFDEACNTLKKQVDNQISSESNTKQIIQKISQTELLIDEIKMNSFYFQDEPFEKEIEKNIAIFNSIKNSTYTNNLIDYSKLLPIKNDFEIKINQIYETILKLYEDKIVNFIQNNVEISVISDFVPTTNKEQQIQKRIILNNPFREINKKTIINLDSVGEIISKDAVIEQIFENKLILTRIPKGKTTAETITTEIIEQIEKNENILITNTNSIFQRTITLDTKNTFSKITIPTQKPFGTYKTILFKNGVEQNYLENEKEIIYAGELKAGEKITMYFYLTGLINTSFEMVENYKTNSYAIQTFKIFMKNMSDYELDATLTLPIKSNKTVKSTTVSNELKEKLKFTTVNDELIVKNELFLPKQTKLYYITLEINDIFEYYQDELQKVYGQLLTFGEAEISSEIAHFLTFVPGENYSEDAQALIKKATIKIDQIQKEKLSEIEILATKERLQNKINELESILTQANQLKLNDTNSIEELIKLALLALQSDDETQLFMALSNIEKFSFSINDKLKEDIEKMWETINKNTTNSDQLDQLKETFFIEKQNFDKIINFDPKNGNASFENLKKIYSDFINTEKKILLDKKETETTMLVEITALKKNISELLIFLESELNIDEKDLIKSKFIPPITQTRLKKIALDVASIDSLEIKEQYNQLENIFRELNAAADYIKSKTIKTYNLAIDNQFSQDQIRKAKTLIDNNKYLSAYFLLQENSITPQGNYYYYFIPIILIVAIGLFLKHKISKQKTVSISNQKDIEKEWD